MNDASWWRPDVSAIAAAIIAPSGRPVAVIAISVPSSRFDPAHTGAYAQQARETTAKTGEAIRKL